MPTGRRDLAKEQYWRRVVDRWHQSSASSKSEFCRQEGIKLNDFCNWEAIIRQRDREQLIARRQEQRALAKARAKQRQTIAKSQLTDQFVQLSVAGIGSQSDRVGVIEISTPGGVLVRLPANLEPSTLSGIFDALLR